MRCGGESFIVAPGKAMHAASLKYITCSASGGWLIRIKVAELARKEEG
jgi:hypothetical protein